MTKRKTTCACCAQEVMTERQSGPALCKQCSSYYYLPEAGDRVHLPRRIEDLESETEVLVSKPQHTKLAQGKLKRIPAGILRELWTDRDSMGIAIVRQ